MNNSLDRQSVPEVRNANAKDFTALLTEYRDTAQITARARYYTPYVSVVAPDPSTVSVQLQHTSYNRVLARSLSGTCLSLTPPHCFATTSVDTMSVCPPMGPVYRQRPIVDTSLLYLGRYDTSGQGWRFLHAIHGQRA
jgi:hypothetical protein